MDPHRIAEVIVARAPGVPGRRGSGYCVRPTAVLTAAHLVEGATEITVRCDADSPDQWSAIAKVAWSDQATDIAVLEIAAPPALAGAGAAGIGRLADRRAVIEVHAAGFPRFKQRQRSGGGAYRDLHDATGTISVLANRRSGTLELTVDPPGADPDSSASPWEAMSGAAVWAEDRIIGVVSAHHWREGLGRLTAARLDRCLQTVDQAAAARLAELLGVGGLSDLPNVLPGPPGWLGRSGYVEQIRDIAPAGGVLRRENELDELAEFCAGDEGYVYWQAGPWAGKSALMSAFVLDPPAGVDVMSFFITARLAAQADSTAFTDALLDQLAALVEEPLPPSLTVAARDHHRRALLKLAAQRTRQAGRRLVLLVDGLDEDSGAQPGAGLPSIASLLPKVPDDGLRIILSGRPAPPIPTDVPDDHPIRSCPRRTLSVSPYATQTQRRARRELDELLAGNQRQQEVLGLITACGGGLSQAELEELTGLAPFELEHLLGGVFGRTIAGRSDHLSMDAHRVFLFAHETLRIEAINRLGTVALQRHTARLHDWADGYRRRGWPEDTPGYLLRGYPRMLQAQSDTARLVDLGTDGIRQDRMLDITGGDGAALAEIKAAQDLVLNEADPDLAAMARLAIHRERLGSRNADVPTDLPRLWALLGSRVRAESLAHSIADPEKQALALVSLAAHHGDPSHAAAQLDAAIMAARGVPNPGTQAEVFVAIVRAAAGIGDHDRALAIADAITDPHQQAQALAIVAEAIAAAGDLGRATALALGIANVYWQARAFAAIAARSAGERLAGMFALDIAAALARRLADPYWASDALAMVIRSATALGHVRQAHVLARRALFIAHAIEHPYWRATALTAIGTALPPGVPRQQQLLAAAEAAAHLVHEPVRAATALIAVVAARTTIGDSDPVRRLTDIAMEAACQIPALDAREAALIDLAVALTAGPFLLDAATVLRAVTTPQTHAIGALRMAVALITHHGRRHLDYAARLARPQSPIVGRMSDSSSRARVLTALATALAENHASTGSGALERARALAEDITRSTQKRADPASRIDVLTSVARELITVGRPHQAAALCDRAVAAALSITDASSTGSVLTELAELLIEFGDYDRAITVARALTDPAAQASALLALAGMESNVDNHAGALDLLGHASIAAGAIADPSTADQTLTDLTFALSTAGDHDRAIETAGRISDPVSQTSALASLAARLSTAGEFDRATTAAQLIRDPSAQASTLTELAGAALLAGDHDRAVNLLDDAYTLAIAMQNLNLVREALADLSRKLPAVGEYDRAITATRGITDAATRAQAQTDLAGTMSTIGDRDRTLDLLDEAVLAARATTNVGDRASMLNILAKKLISAGEPDRAIAAIRFVTDIGFQTTALTGLVEALAEAGEYDRAVAAANTIADHTSRAEALSQLARRLHNIGEHERAVGLFDRAISTALAISVPLFRDGALSDVARGLATAGEHDRASVVAHDIRGPLRRSAALADLGGKLVADGRHDRAIVLFDQAFAAAGAAVAAGDAAATGPFSHTATLTDLAWKLSAMGDYIRALAAARAIFNPLYRANALTHLARKLLDAGDHEQAIDLADEAIVTAYEIWLPSEQARPLAELARFLAKAGEYDRAITAARAIAEPAIAVPVFGILAGILLDAGEHDRAMGLFDNALSSARTIVDAAFQVTALVDLTRTLATAGEYDRAIATARAIADAAAQARSLIGLVETLIDADKRRPAMALLDEAITRTRTIPDANSRARILADLAGRLVAAGDDRATGLIDEAITAARASTDQAAVLLDLSRALSTLGKYDAAIVAARSISHPDAQAKALTGLVQRLTAGHDQHRAMTAARAITDQAAQATVLSRIARSLSVAQLRPLVAHALASGGWIPLLTAIARADPTVLLVIANEL